MDEDIQIQKALNCFERTPSDPEKKPSVIPHLRDKQANHLLEYIREDTEIRFHEDRITANTVVRDLRELLAESMLDADPIKEFKTRVEDYQDKTKGWMSHQPGDLYETYQVYFPLYLSRDWVLPDTLESREYSIKRIDYSDWKKKVELLRDGWIDSGTYENFSPNPLEDEHAAHWMVECKAHDGPYASYIASEVIELFLAKTNYLANYTQFTSKRKFGLLYSYLKKPHVYLTFQEDNFRHVQISDLERRMTEPINWDRYGIYETIQSLPTLPWPLDSSAEKKRLNSLLVKSLFEYQRAITSSDIHNAFAGFWRTLELLTQTKKQEPASMVVDRAEFAYRTSATMNDRLEEFLADLPDTRSKYIHEGYYASTIANQDMLFAKNLAEELIRFYFENYNALDTREDFEDYLRLGLKMDGYREDIVEFEKLNQKIGWISSGINGR